MTVLIAVEPAQPAQGRQPRTRRTHTRSRTGCLPCRKRHRRCDEQRPICGNCATARSPCEYRQAPPLRERRKACIPGEQQPWAPPAQGHDSLVAASLSRAIGPCRSYPIDMPYKSGELFHYFYELENPASLLPMEKHQDLLNSAMQAPDALRNSILVAGLYISWNVGHLNNFEPSVLFHKLETIRLVNGWLQNPDPKAYWVCVRNIASLAFIEGCLGGIATAETHLDGLVRFMDLREPQTALDLNRRVEDELSTRFFLLTLTFMQGFKSHVWDIVDDDVRRRRGYTPTANEVRDLVHAWHKQDPRAMEIKLGTLKFIPFFFAPHAPTTTFLDVDCSTAIDCLASLTETSRLRHEPSHQPHNRKLMWREGAANQLFRTFVGTHVHSISGREDAAPREEAPRCLMTSWSGMATAVCLYLNSVLWLWNAGEPVRPRVHRRVLSILQRDLEKSGRQRGSGCRLSLDLWFWKAFVGAFSLAMSSPDGDRDIFHDSESAFGQFICAWSRKSGVRDWAGAKAALARIVWPEWFLGEGLAQALWESTVGIE